jgi:hypothetical protein
MPDPVLDGVLDERLEQQRGETNVAKPRGYVNRDPEPMLKTSALDVEICLDQIEFTP